MEKVAVDHSDVHEVIKECLVPIHRLMAVAVISDECIGQIDSAHIPIVVNDAVRDWDALALPHPSRLHLPLHRLSTVGPMDLGTHGDLSCVLPLDNQEDTTLDPSHVPPLSLFGQVVYEGFWDSNTIFSYGPTTSNVLCIQIIEEQRACVEIVRVQQVPAAEETNKAKGPPRLSSSDRGLWWTHFCLHKHKSSRCSRGTNQPAKKVCSPILWVCP